MSSFEKANMGPKAANNTQSAKIVQIDPNWLTFGQKGPQRVKKGNIGLNRPTLANKFPLFQSPAFPTSHCPKIPCNTVPKVPKFHGPKVP